MTKGKLDYWMLRAQRAEEQLAGNPHQIFSHNEWVRKNPEPDFSSHDLMAVKDALMLVWPMELSVDDFIDYYLSDHENPDALTDEQIDDIYAAMQHVENCWSSGDGDFTYFMEQTQERLNSLLEAGLKENA